MAVGGPRCPSGSRTELSIPRFGGQWTDEKLAILRAYIDAYTTALKKQPFTLAYVDAFAGPGSYSAARDEYAEFDAFRTGSPKIALETGDKPFDKLVFIEKDAKAAGELMTLSNSYRKRNISVLQGDANEEIPKFCKAMQPFDRAVVFLDPYATEVSWPTVEAIARTKRVDCWILFPLMAVSRMMPTDREPVESWARRLDAIFGGRKYWMEGYQDSLQMRLFGVERKRERTWTSEQIAQRYKQRLVTASNRVSETSRTLRNSRNVPLFELFFAAANPVGARRAIPIASHILDNF